MLSSVKLSSAALTVCDFSVTMRYGVSKYRKYGLHNRVYKLLAYGFSSPLSLDFPTHQQYGGLFKRVEEINYLYYPKRKQTLLKVGQLDTQLIGILGL